VVGQAAWKSTDLYRATRITYLIVAVLKIQYYQATVEEKERIELHEQLTC
jgi:hypothetical protein